MQILNSIKTIGFKESVVKFSIADSKKILDLLDGS